MSLREWNAIMERIESERIRDRAEAILRFREFLSQTRQFSAVCDEPNHSWIKTLQSLFHLVIIERNGYVAKPSVAAQQRLEDAAQLVQWTVQKVHTRVPRKTIKAIFAHLTQLVAVQGKLQIFALIYLKTLRVLLSYPPHLEHLDERQWTDVVSLCFAAVLGDNIKIGQEFADEFAMEVDSDSPAYPIGTLRANDGDTLAGSASTTKRVATQEVIELLSCIEVAFRSTSAPFILYSNVIFHKFLRFFRLYPGETTAHVPALRALTRALSELDLNDQKVMREVGSALWTPILDLWSTKNAVLKEQIVIALKRLFPSVVPRDVPDHLAEAFIKPLFEAVVSEPTIRWRDGFELNIDTLRLGLDEEEDTKLGAFRAKTFRIGSDFGDKHAVAWTVLELGADCLMRLCTISEVAYPFELVPPAHPSDNGRRNKRRKIEEPLTIFIDALQSAEPATQTCFRLQLLLMLVERHWPSFHLGARHRIFQAMLPLLSQDDLQIQNWAFMVLAAIANGGLEARDVFDTPSPSKRPRQSSRSATEHWDQVWSLVTRRMSAPGVCRVASHVANVLLAMDCVASSEVAASLDGFARDLEVQGPSFPSDAVCTFFEWCLAIASSDIRLFRLRFPEKICAWLSTTWKPLDGIIRAHSIGQTRPHGDPFSPAHLASLIARFCGVEYIPRFPYVFLVPDCAVAEMAIAMCETAPIRDYVEGHVPPYSFAKGKRSIHQHYRTPLTVSAPTPAPDGLERRTSLWLERTLDSLVAVNENQAYWSSMSVEVARRHLDLATLALVVEGLFQTNEIGSTKTTIKAACVVLSHHVPTLALKKWQSFELLTLLNGLTPLLVPLPVHPAVRYPVLLDPGSASGIPHHLIPPPTAVSHSVDFGSAEFSLLHVIWSDGHTRVVLREVASTLHKILAGITSEAPLPIQGSSQGWHDRDQDDFGEIKVSKQLQVASSTRSERAEMGCVALCVRGLISDAMADGAVGSVRVPQIVDAILNTEGTEAIAIAELAFDAVWVGLLDFRARDAASILDHFGSVLLPDYRFARDERFALAALRFLECTAPTWVFDEGKAVNDFGTKTRELCGWFVEALQRKKLYSWRVRLRLTAFLDTYLSIDRTQTLWNLHGSERALPTGIIPSMLADLDFRVRFRAATSSAQLFTFMHENGIEEAPLFHDIKDNLETNLSNVERQLTQFICNANIFIVSAVRRRGPYILLVGVAALQLAFAPQIVALLSGAAERVGLPDYRSLYVLYQRYYAHQFTRGQVAAPSPEVLGFSSLAELRRADIHEYGSMLLFHGKDDLFATACNILKRSRSSCVLACLPETLAHILLDFCSLHPSAHAPWETLRAQFEELLASAGAQDAYQSEHLLISVSDVLVARVISAMHEYEWDPDHPHVAFAVDSKTCASFYEILALQQPLHLNDTPPPIYSPSVVLLAYRWLIGEFPVLRTTPVVYASIQHLLARIHSEPFLDMQRSLLVSLAMTLALSSQVVQGSPVIVEAVVECLVQLLKRVPDLADLLFGITRWCIKTWIALVQPGNETGVDLCALLVRAAHVCSALATSPTNGEAIKCFATTLDTTIGDLSRSVDKAIVATTLLLWPWEIVDSSTLNIEQALSSSFAPLPKFALARSLNVKAVFSRTDAQTQHHILWKLLEAMSPTMPLNFDDCSALVDLLYEAGGDVVVPPIATSDRSHFASDVADDSGLQRAILVHLLTLLPGPDQRVATVAFRTVRAVFGSITEDVAADLCMEDHLPSRASRIATLVAAPLLRRPTEVRVRTRRHLAELANDSWIVRGQDYASWIVAFAEFLADCRAEGAPFYAQLEGMFQQSDLFTKDVLPLLVHSILLRGFDTGETESRTLLSLYFRRLLADPLTSVPCVEVVVAIVIHLRQHLCPNSPSNFSACDVWLAIPWTLLAAGAAKAGYHVAVLLFLELAHEYDGLFQLDQSAEPKDRQQDVQAQDLLYEVYARIDEPDGFYGRQSAEVRQSLIRRYRHEGRWSDAFGTYGAHYETASGDLGGNLGDPATVGVVESLASHGFNRLAMAIMQPARASGAIREKDVPPALPYELAWRTDTWDLPVEARSLGASSVAVYSALKMIHTARDTRGLQSTITALVVSEASKLASVSLERPTPDKNAISALLSLREIKAWAARNLDQNLSDAVVATLPQISSSVRFEHAEQILSTRISLLRTIRRREYTEQVGDAPSALSEHAAKVEQLCLLNLSKTARGAGHLQASLNAVTLAHKLLTGDATVSAYSVDEELANVLWAQGEHGTAMTVLKSVNYTDPGQKALVLAQLGEWTSEARMKSALEIKDTYFDPAVEVMGAASADDRSRVFGSYAKFADAQYQEMAKATELKRDRFERYSQRKEAELQEIEKQLRTTRDGSLRSQLEKGRNDGKLVLIEDRRQVEASEKSTALMLSIALKNFSQALAASSRHDDQIFRFCALWLAHAADVELHSQLYRDDLLHRVPSHKYVFLAHQLSARLSTSTKASPFAKNISRLVFRLCHDHPFHCLFPVHALRGSVRSTPGAFHSRRSSTSSSASDTDRGSTFQASSSRAQAAEAIFTKLKKLPHLKPRIEALELACRAYTEWANFDLKSGDEYYKAGKIKKGALVIRRDMLLRTKLRDLPIPVSTFNLPLDLSGKYPDGTFPSIVRYQDTFTTAGGIHVPKIVICQGDDGKGYKQLLKGGDDIRQDAVMEQSFSLINTLLDRDARSRQRRLQIRTYRVIPLPENSGLIEFVDKTKSLNDVLAPLYATAKGYLTPPQAREKLACWERKKKEDPDWMIHKEEAFRDVLKRMPPVMRHVFFSQHKVPSQWFDMRLNYSRSVATTSIIGHIVGLGDRHVSNILMDTSRGDLVAIDLGIAFDQGKRLPIPELVPFRLTQNIVDGFGMTGVDGVFRRCSEEVLRVLRDRSEVVLTVLEVFKHDPLQHWAISADIARQIQGSEDGEGAALDELPDDADRALAIVSGKLEKKLSVEYTVNQLIHEATATFNLGRIFCGWQAYL